MTPPGQGSWFHTSWHRDACRALFPTPVWHKDAALFPIANVQSQGHCTSPTSLPTSRHTRGQALGDNAIPCPPWSQPLDSPGARGLAAGRADAGENTSPLEPGWQIMWLVTRWLYRMSLVVEMKPQLWQTPEGTEHRAERAGQGRKDSTHPWNCWKGQGCPHGTLTVQGVRVHLQVPLTVGFGGEGGQADQADKRPLSCQTDGHSVPRGEGQGP